MMLILVLVNIVETVAVVELFGHFILNKPFLESISWYVSVAWDGICDMFRVIFRPGSFTEEALREMTGLWDMGLSGVKACMILQGIMCLVLFLTPLVAVGKAALADEDDGILP